jgi:hypothetical protein
MACARVGGWLGRRVRYVVESRLGYDESVRRSSQWYRVELNGAIPDPICSLRSCRPASVSGCLLVYSRRVASAWSFGR